MCRSSSRFKQRNRRPAFRANTTDVAPQIVSAIEATTYSSAIQPPQPSGSKHSRHDQHRDANRNARNVSIPITSKTVAIKLVSRFNQQARRQRIGTEPVPNRILINRKPRRTETEMNRPEKPNNPRRPKASAKHNPNPLENAPLSDSPLHCSIPHSGPITIDVAHQIIAARATEGRTTQVAWKQNRRSCAQDETMQRPAMKASHTYYPQGDLNPCR